MHVRKFPRRTLLLLLITSLSLAACNVGSTPAPTVDINAINTAAVATALGQISAQQTQTALAAPVNTDTPAATDTAIPQATFVLPTTAVAGALPTLSFNTTPNTTQVAGLTPISSPVAPVNTAVLGDSCNNSIYVADVTIPDGTVLQPGVDFEKIWRVQNTGTCTWDDGYQLAFVSGDQALDPVSFEFTDKADFVAGGATADIGVNLTAPNTAGDYTATWRMQSDNGTFFGTYLTVVIKVQ
jgi:hypothetical protein